MFKQTGHQLAQHDLQIREVCHQEQRERAAVLLVRNCGSREQRREEKHQRQLEHREHQVQDAAEPRHHPQLAHVLPAHERLPGCPHQDEEKAAERCSPKVITQRPGGSQNLPGYDGSGKQGQTSSVGYRKKGGIITLPMRCFVRVQERILQRQVYQMPDFRTNTTPFSMVEAPVTPLGFFPVDTRRRYLCSRPIAAPGSSCWCDVH